MLLSYNADALRFFVPPKDIIRFIRLQDPEKVYYNFYWGDLGLGGGFYEDNKTAENQRKICPGC